MNNENNGMQIYNKYGANATMFLIGNMSPVDMYLGSDMCAIDDIQNVIKANKMDCNEKMIELGIDLVYLGMMYGFKQVKSVQESEI